jgi:hypothetical protein
MKKTAGYIAAHGQEITPKHLFCIALLPVDGSTWNQADVMDGWAG